MKVCVIGDIHGTTKFIDCYMDIIAKNNDCERIIVLGDHFDPYENISTDVMVERYNEFIDICKKDNRVISILGNHDLASYVIRTDCTNRTERSFGNHSKITEAIKENLGNNYLIYKIGDYLFSHAGVSQFWLDDNMEYKDELLSNKKGWSVEELTKLVSYYDGDWSGYGNNVRQGCTWIRPEALDNSAVENYNQVVGHTQVEDIVKIKLTNGKYLWMIDNQRKSEYLTLEIKEESD